MYGIKENSRCAPTRKCIILVFANFFTSFGYFKKAEHNTVLRNMYHALKQDGKLVLDYMNIYYTEKRLIAEEEKEIDGIIYRITRWTDDKYFLKKS